MTENGAATARMQPTHEPLTLDELAWRIALREPRVRSAAPKPNDEAQRARKAGDRHV